MIERSRFKQLGADQDIVGNRLRGSHLAAAARRSRPSGWARAVRDGPAPDHFEAHPRRASRRQRAAWMTPGTPALVRVASSLRFAYQGRSVWRTRRSDSISTPRLASQPRVERFRRRGHDGMKIEATTAQGSNPPPFAHQSHVAEQGRLDCKHVEPGHVAARDAALEH